MAPSQDGDVTCFISPEVVNKSWFTPGKPVIFVNGMMNSPANHAESAMAISLMLGAPVYGVFNAKINFVSDLWQCLTDKLRLAGVQALPRAGFANWSRVIDAQYAVARQRNPALSKAEYVASLLGANRATQALFRLLVGSPAALLGRPIHCHSQGNLITSNALTAVALARGLGSIDGQPVFSYGSPCRYWPHGIARVNNAFTFDPVSMLDLRADLTSAKIGWKASHGFPAVHGFQYYAEHDGEFIVNRFRFGGWGMTLNMDEKGLARFCVAMGTNIRRLRSVFDRLEKAHPTDSDDVAVTYVDLLSDGQIAALRSAGPEFIAQLRRILSSGVPFPDERAAIRRLG